MADTGERDIRDRVAEALYRADAESGRNIRWANLAADVKAYWGTFADKMLAALPTVGLRIGRVEE